MFTKKKHEKRNCWNLSFSIMLAQELLRAELARALKIPIQFFNCNIDAVPINRVRENSEGMTEVEYHLGRFDQRHIERYINLTVIISSAERLFYGSPVSDKRMKLWRVNARLRLFSIEAVTFWKPHFVEFEVHGLNNTDPVISEWSIVYSDGVIRHLNRVQNSNNPCEVMCVSQIGATIADLNPGV